MENHFEHPWALTVIQSIFKLLTLYLYVNLTFPLKLVLKLAFPAMRVSTRMREAAWNGVQSLDFGTRLPGLKSHLGYSLRHCLTTR